MSVCCWECVCGCAGRCVSVSKAEVYAYAVVSRVCHRTGALVVSWWVWMVLGRRSVRAWQCGTYNATTSDYIQRSRTNWEKLNNYVSDDDDGNVAGSGKRTANLRPTSVHGRKV